ncbi:MAG: hypothetical protein J5482_05005 [Oscillospiraceae bacterium]|nr:hypothetical protein [Oscillospiraceae bacterium]
MDKMVFEPGNPQEEKPKRIRKKERRRGKWWLLIVLTVLVLAGVLAAVLWDAASFDGLRRSIIYARAEKDENGCAALYGYASDRGSRFAALEGSLLIASPGQIRLVGENGALRFDESVRFQNCAIAEGKKTAAVYDIGGTDIYVLDSRGLVRRLTAEGEILSVTVNEKGYLAVTVNAAGYKAFVSVYDSAGEPVFTFRSADRFVMTAAVSRDNRYLEAVTLGQTDGVFANRLVTYRLDSTEPVGSCDLTGGAIYDVGTVGRSFCAVAEDALHFLSAAGEWKSGFVFDGDSLRRCDLNGDGYATLLLGHYKTGSQCRLVTVNENGSVLASLEVDSDVLDLSAAGRYIAVLYSDHLTVYDRELTERATLTDVSMAKEVMMRQDGSAVLAGASAASLYLP